MAAHETGQQTRKQLRLNLPNIAQPETGKPHENYRFVVISGHTETISGLEVRVLPGSPNLLGSRPDPARPRGTPQLVVERLLGIGTQFIWQLSAAVVVVGLQVDNPLTAH